MMKKDSTTDYLGCILLKFLGPVIRALPLEFSLFLGRLIGDLFYFFDYKHRAAAFSNIHAALGERLPPFQIKKVTKNFYRNFGQNLIEIFLIPLIDKKYIDKYINIEGLDNIREAFKKGKGVILAGMHEGSWELSNIISANLGFSFVLFVRNQKFPRLNALLNSYRIKKGCKVIKREGDAAKEGGEFYGIRSLIEALKRNEAIGMTVDQGGKSGIPVKFFGKDASMPSGAVKFALKYDAVIVPAFYSREKGPYHTVIVSPPVEIKRTGNSDADIRDNLQRIVAIFEKHISAYPQEYLWTYKIWKYSTQRNILILSDGKTGHMRQSEAAAQIISGYLKEKGIISNISTVEVKYKHRFFKYAQAACVSLSGKYSCQGCVGCLRCFLQTGAYHSLISRTADIVISCGSSVAGVNYVYSKYTLAKSIAIMRTAFINSNKFDLAIVPRHDRPSLRKNVVVTEGALNLINEQYLKEQTGHLRRILHETSVNHRFHVGLLIGGDTKDFRLSKGLMSGIIGQLKSFVQKEDAGILVTTSRRTSPEVEDLVDAEFRAFSRCNFLLLAHKHNFPFAVGGILGIAKVIIVSPESISMVSEAAGAGRYIIVFESDVSRRHRKFLNYLAGEKYIYLTPPQNLLETLNDILAREPEIKTLKDESVVKDALSHIL